MTQPLRVLMAALPVDPGLISNIYMAHKLTVTLVSPRTLHSCGEQSYMQTK